ncbi:MAG: hypothetical protein C0499_05070 [Zymomonas sp.]|nr:hypothetical protein [Zymomonas sp.]PZP12559.1 MAG: hypothetical protein DI607_09400 [Sphingomonas hengshuiensis]
MVLPLASNPVIRRSPPTCRASCHLPPVRTPLCTPLRAPLCTPLRAPLPRAGNRTKLVPSKGHPARGGPYCI